MNSAPKYHIIKELGSGAQGAVYLVKDPLTRLKYAAKVYAKHDRFTLEEQIMRKVRGNIGFPWIEDSTEIEEHSVVVMNILGENLRTLKDRYSGKLSTHTCLQIFHQIVQQLSNDEFQITRLEVFHNLGYVHCDLKPDNILISNDKQDTNIYLVDYGLAHYFLDKNGNHMRQPEKVSFKGSISYCSLNLLNKQRNLSQQLIALDPSRRDDLESLIYVILFLQNGQLPWHDGAQKLRGQERLNFVIRMKQELSIKEYGSDIPKSILKCYKYLRTLDYENKPDYNKLRYFIEKDLQQQGLTLNGIYEWTDYILQPVLTLPMIDGQNQFILKSLYEREYEKVSVEEHSMEADYKDFMSIEIEEGISIQINNSYTKRNQLSSLSPTSLGYSHEDSSNGDKGTNRNRKQAKAQFSFNLRPFSLEDEKDGEAKSQEEVKENEMDVDIDELLQTKRVVSFSIDATQKRALQDKRTSAINLIQMSFSNIKQ